MKIQRTITNILSYLIGVFLIFGAYGHISKPEAYSAMIPDFIPDMFAHVFAIIAEASVAIALFIPKFRKWGALGFTLLMMGFLPLHIWDLFRENHAENPLIPTAKVAYIRFAIQSAMIALGYWMYRVQSKTKKNMN